MACMWARAVLLRDLQGEDVTTFKAEIDLILGWAEEQRRSKEQAKVQHRRPKRGTKEQAMMALMIAYQNNVHKGMQPHMAASRACMWARAVLLCDLQGEDAIAFEFEIDLISDTAEEQRREEWDAQQAKKPNFRPRKPEPAFSPTRRETALKEPSNRPGLSREEQEKRAAAKKALRRQRAEASAQASAHLDASMIEKPGDQRKQAMERIANKAKKGGDGDGKKGKKGKKK